MIARRAGAYTETIEHGVTGYLVDDLDEAVLAVSRTPQMDRARVRSITRERFDVERMVDAYERVYGALVDARQGALADGGCLGARLSFLSSLVARIASRSHRLPADGHAGRTRITVRVTKSQLGPRRIACFFRGRDDRSCVLIPRDGRAGPRHGAVLRRGCTRLALAGTDEPHLRDLATDLGLDADRWMPVVVDLRDRDATRDALAATEGALGRIDVLIHLVGGWVGGTPVAELDPGETVGMLDQHLWTTLHVTQAVVPGMVERGWGRVLAVSAPVAAEPAAKAAAYSIGNGRQGDAAADARGARLPTRA